MADCVTISWDGTWRGSFGARADLVLIFEEGDLVEALFLGQPMQVALRSGDDERVVLSGPDGSLTLTRMTGGSAQAIYVNLMGKKASALLTRA